jgi:colanic acid/amylovoran biosynthesis glycosyltransferase
VLSEFLKKRVMELGCLSENLYKIPLGTDLSQFQFVPRKIRVGRPLSILSVGRLAEMKGHRYLIQAVVGLLSQGYELELKIIGKGVLRTELEEQIAESGWECAIRLMGGLPSSEVSRFMSMADVFILAGTVSDDGFVETQGVVFAEAQATGLPVVGCAVGGAAESFVDGETGFLCPPRDVNALKVAILRFYESPELVPIFGERGRSFVEKEFSVSLMAERLEGLYIQLG